MKTQLEEGHPRNIRVHVVLVDSLIVDKISLVHTSILSL